MQQDMINPGSPRVAPLREDSGPWWREPWPWILMAGPFLAMVGCIITIYLAFQDGGSQPVRDGGIRQGLVVTGPAASSGAGGQGQQAPSVTPTPGG